MTLRPWKFRLMATVAAVLAVAVGASIANAASLSVGSARITTSSSAVTVPPATCSIVASEDAALDRATQTSNYGGYAFLSVRAENKNNQRRSLVKFDLASCNIPASALVMSASLRLTVVSPPGSSHDYSAHRVTGAWSENSVTYANQPAFSSTATATIATGGAPSSLSWSVLGDVSAFVKGTTANNGWLLRDVAETSNPSTETLFASRESATSESRPALEVVYYP